ncbi:MAG: hypothetical protein IIZ39_04285, partial [Blautia sp.]|nr:hypothetical protein [Blautia sp.]
MKIENIRINGLAAPMGFLLDHLSVSFQVTHTQAKAASYARVELLSEEGELLTFAEGELDCAFTRLEASLSP